MVAAQEDVEVVISGIGGYFPQSKNVEELQKILLEHKDAMEAARWKGTMDVCDRTGNVTEIDFFDSSFFGSHHKQAVYLNPMSRMLLQNTLEAILDAGMTPAAFRGRRVLVAAASSISENDSLMFENVENGFGVTGQARCMIANRISYWLHTTGPSYACDATWLGGMQVLQHGYDAIRTGNCEAAIVCAANLTMNIWPTYLFKNLGVTSSDGVTNTFGENAQGYARSDSTCVFVLQRTDKAKRRYCTLVNVDTFFNGYRLGQFVKVDIDPARRFLQKFYQNCDVDPTQVTFVETYGSALKELDKIELNLIDDIFNNGNRESPLLIGAVKTNIGHTEASDALISIIKTIIAMECGTIPANLHTENPRTDIPALTEGRLKIVTENAPWNGTYAAVNSFGIASAFGHVLLKRNPVDKIPQAIETPIKLPLLHIMATRSEDGIKDIIERVKNFEDNIDYTNLINGTFATHIPGYLYRMYVVKNSDNTFKDESSYYSGITRPVWFIYSGMGSQWLGMGKALLELPIFARAIEKCANALKPFNVDLMNIITGNDETLFDTILNSFVGIASIQIGLTDVLFSLGISPDGILGHSVGELGCAYADGCVTAEQMILSAYYRGRASLEAELIPGLMAAVGVGAKEAAKFVSVYPSIDIACHNGPDSCTLSGPKEDMEKVVKELQGKGIFARLVNVAGIAYHSRYIKPAAPLLLNYLNSLIPDPKERSSKWLSTSVPESRWHTDLAQTVSAEYLTNNLLSSVYFEEALRHIPKGSVLIEIAPHGLLQAILKRSVHQDSVNVALTRRGCENGLEFLFAAIGKLYLSGVQLDLSSLYEDVHPRSVIAPRGTPSIAPLVRWVHNEKWRSGIDEFKDNSAFEQIFSLSFHSDWFRDIINHRIHSSPIIPATAYLPLVREIVNNIEKVDAINISNFFVQRNRLLGRDEYTPPIRIMVQRATGIFEVTDRYGSIATGQATVPEAQEMQELLNKMSEDNRNEKLLGQELFKLNGDEIYRELAMRGLELNGIFRAITDVRIYKNGLEATILWKNNFAFFATSIFHAHILHPSIPLDCLMPSYIRHMFFNFKNIPEENTPIPVRYTGPLDSIWSPIMLMDNIKCSPTLGVARRTLRATASRFIPEEMDEDVGVVVDACLQTVKRGLEDGAEFGLIVYNNNATKPIRNILKQISQQNNEPRLQIHDIDNFTDDDELPTAQLLVASSLENASKYLQNNPNTYILLCSDDNIKNSNLIQILLSNDKGIRLLKQINNEEPVIVHINERIINDDDAENSALDWVRDLRTKLENSNSRVYVVCKYLPTDDLDSFIKTVKHLKGGHKARFLFILDENAPKVTPNESFYSRVYQQDVTVSVYVHGTWGSRYSNDIRITDKDFSEENEQNDNQDIDININNADVKYIGVHSANVIPVETNEGTTPKLGLVDYCGTKRGTNTRVMGVCDASLTPDPIFQWNVPAKWSFVDGATVPAAYALAYYALVELASLNAGETVLIHNACSALGQAMIHVAFSLKTKILATVGNDRQKGLLLQHMKMLNNDTVFYYTNSNFEQKVMDITKGQGVDVLINFTKGERLRASARCIAALGRAVLLQDEIDPNAPVNTEILGLGTFLRCVGMYGVFPARLCNWDEDKKHRIHQLVQQGLDNAAVMPIRRNIFKDNQPIENVVRYVTGLQVTGCAILPVQQKNIPYSLTSIYQCDSDKPYVLYGLNSHVEHLLLTLIWLAKHNAKKIILIVAPKNNSEKLFIERQLQNLNIIVDVKDNLSAIRKLKNIAAIICLSDSKNISPNSIPPNTRLIHFLGINSPSTLPPNPFRSTLRYATSRIEDVFPFLNYALSQTVDLITHGDDDNQTVEENFTFKDFFRLLEGSVPSLLTVKIEPVDSVTVEKVTSAGTGEIREIPPLFVVPGLLGTSCRYLQQTIMKILGPVYVINAQQRSLRFEDIANTAVQRICEVYPKGPYNIAGVSTGGILALEIARLLDEKVGSNNVQLYLIDGVPATFQYLINEAQTSSQGFDSVLIQYLLQINQPEILNEIMSKNKTWQSRLSSALNLFNLTRSECQQITQTINILRERLELIQKYSVTEELLNIPTKLLRPSVSTKDFSNSLFKICKQFRLEVFKGNHFTMLQTQAVADYINDNIITPPIYC